MQRAWGIFLVAVLGSAALSCSDDSNEAATDRGQSDSTVAVDVAADLPSSDTDPSVPGTTAPETADAAGIEPFDFATESLCDRISRNRVEEIESEAFATHDAAPVPSGFSNGTAVDPAYRSCSWTFEGGGQVGLLEAERADVARDQWTFVSHPALSEGVAVSDERLDEVGEIGDFVPGLEVRLLVEGQDSSLEFWHSAPVGYRGDEAALLAVADGLLREMGWVPTAAVEAFSFADDDLCEWVSSDDVAEWVAAEFEWDGTASEVPSTDQDVGCEWTLDSAEGDRWFITVGDAGLWQDFSGKRYDFEARMTAAGVTEYPPPRGFVEIGAWVAGHPALSDRVVVHNGGFGQFAFGVPPGPWLQVTMLTGDAFDGEWDDGAASEEYEHDYFAIADRFLRELGWVS